MRSWLMGSSRILREGSVSIILRKVRGYAKNARNTTTIFGKNAKNAAKKDNYSEPVPRSERRDSDRIRNKLVFFRK